MKKQIAIATVAIMLMAVLIAPPVMASVLRDDKTIDVDGKQLKVVELKLNSIEDIIGGKEVIHIRHYISGYVNHGEARGDVWYLTEGVRVEITIDHTPTDATGVLLGVWDWDDLSNGEYIIDNDQDGHAHFPSSGTYTIPEDGNYYIAVGALDGGFSYEGWYDVYW
ncbi:MAG: hypothetical protein WAV32_04190 [Halobacteriota archaeon]